MILKNAVRVEEREIVVNNPSELIVHIPALSTGKYQLTISTQYSGASILKEPRARVYEKILTVQ